MKPMVLFVIILTLLLGSQPAISSYAAPPEEPEEEILSVYLPVVFKKYPPRNIFGIHMTSLNTANGLDKMRAAKATWTRRVVEWNIIEPTEGARNWDAALDQELITARQNDIHVVLIIESTPAWALKPGYACGAVAADKFNALGNFVYDLASRYSAAPFEVEYYELWNEPDASGTLGCWGDPGDPYYWGGRYYGQMLKSVVPRLKSAAAQAQALVGGLLLDCDPYNPPTGHNCTSAHFLRGILVEGGGPYFDGVAFHGYDYYLGRGTYSAPNWHASWNTTGPVSIVKSDFLKKVLVQYGQSQKYLINTENAVFYGPNDQTITCVDTAPADVEITKLYYMIHSYAQAMSQGWRAHIWFSVFGLRCTGLLETNLDEKPVYRAYGYMADRVGGAQFGRYISEYNGVVGYEFVNAENRVWILWSKDGANHLINLPVAPLAVERIGDDGSAVVEAPGITTLVNMAPLFVTFSR